MLVSYHGDIRSLSGHLLTFLLLVELCKCFCQLILVAFYITFPFDLMCSYWDVSIAEFLEMLCGHICGCMLQKLQCICTHIYIYDMYICIYTCPYIQREGETMSLYSSGCGLQMWLSGILEILGSRGVRGVWPFPLQEDPEFSAKSKTKTHAQEAFGSLVSLELSHEVLGPGRRHNNGCGVYVPFLNLVYLSCFGPSVWYNKTLFSHEKFCHTKQIIVMA